LKFNIYEKYTPTIERLPGFLSSGDGIQELAV
jgi:hypothetical protein